MDFGLKPRREVRVPDERFASVLRGEAGLLFDGGMGTELQRAGLAPGEAPEFWCITRPEEVTRVHAAYVAAGSDVITTNTFGANARKLRELARAQGLVRTPSVAQVFTAAVRCARDAGARYVAADIGPTGALLRPMGTLAVDEAIELFAEEVRAAKAAGADLIVIETMTDLLEAKCAVLAAKENSDLPIFCTMTFGEDGRTFLGTTPEVAAITLSAVGADVVGINCSLGPAEIAPLVDRMLAWSSVPVIVQANAGLPRVVEGRTVYGIDAKEYAEQLAPMLERGVTVIGGCCGTTPAYIALERTLLDRGVSARPSAPERASALTVTSATRHVALMPGEVAVIGERINPTGKRRLKEALRTGDYDYVLTEALAQERAGAEVLDVNAGLPEIDEARTLVRLVEELTQVCPVPLQIDSTDARAMEAALRAYPGKAIVNSCSGRADSLSAILPLAAHYGAAVVGLTLDEEGIPGTAEGRLEIARRIVRAAEELGIPRSDVLIDCLTMAVSTDQTAAGTILEAMRLVRRELPGVRLVLGVSNVSFGLPYRELLGSVFLASAFAAGLDLAIINPLSERFADTVDAWRVLSGQDAGAAHYIERNTGRTDAQRPAAPATAQVTDGAPDGADPLLDAVLQGRAEAVGREVASLIERGADPMGIVNDHLIPALDEVGARFEAHTFFLPQLMAASDAAKAGFEEVRRRTAHERSLDAPAIALATVRGDIHDIGKNIVRMLLENYGYKVHDLGRDVAPEDVVAEVVRCHIVLCGLSALMTTTVPAMAETIALLRERAPWCKVMVGGAVLTPEYAGMVGADFYAKDAAESARIAHEVFG